MTSATTRDAYAILGVGRDADDLAIAMAYRALARQFHPDVAGDLATGRMSEINAAFEAIRTAAARAAYAEVSVGAARDRPVGAQKLDGTGAAGPPPGRPSGSVLAFGRHLGWSLGEIARVDPGYLVWLAEKREGRPYLDEIDALLARTGYGAGRTGGSGSTSSPGRGVFDRR
jgi:curved DNA-binding protein CbpA